MDAKHTPGPWRFDYDGLLIVSSSANGREVASIDSISIEQDADARLIATAPELLEALIEMRDLFDLMCGLGFNPAEGREGSPKAKADAAISKATGSAA
jgi:hypothetical protein